MELILFIILLFIVLVGGGWKIGKWIGNAIFPDERKTYVDKSVHHHYHSTTHNHEHKNISIIDDETKNKILELKKSKYEKNHQ